MFKNFQLVRFPFSFSEDSTDYEKVLIRSGIFTGFGKSMDIHRKLVRYIQTEIGELLVDPSNGWDIKLESIWRAQRNIILSYDHIEVVNEFPSLVFQSVQQRWGNCQSLVDLKRFLSPAGHTFVLLVFTI